MFNEETFAPHMDEEQYINRDQLLKDYATIIDGGIDDILKLKKEVKDLHTELEYYRGFAEHLGAKKAVSQRDKMVQESQEIEQILGKALGYPWFKDDPKNFPNATEADGVCIGPNTAASLAMEAADRIKNFLLLEEYNKLKNITDRILREFPVGNIAEHTIESIPERISYYLKELTEYTQRVEDLEIELEELRMLYDESLNPHHKDGR